ncbi:MAG: hypothetical protein AAGB12_02460, partial [Pseudomonadota bacterium]
NEKVEYVVLYDRLNYSLMQYIKIFFRLSENLMLTYSIEERSKSFIQKVLLCVVKFEQARLQRRVLGRLTKLNTHKNGYYLRLFKNNY